MRPYTTLLLKIPTLWEPLSLACAGSYHSLCHVTADTSKVKLVHVDSVAGSYYILDFKVVLLFGLTELKAQIAWTGEDVRGLAVDRFSHLAHLTLFSLLHTACLFSRRSGGRTKVCTVLF